MYRSRTPPTYRYICAKSKTIISSQHITLVWVILIGTNNIYSPGARSLYVSQSGGNLPCSIFWKVIGYLIIAKWHYSYLEIFPKDRKNCYIINLLKNQEIPKWQMIQLLGVLGSMNSYQRSTFTSEVI